MMPATDWMGNVIKAGDTILTFRTKPIFSHYFEIINLATGKVETKEHPPTPEFIWEKIGEGEVVAGANTLFYETKTPYGTISLPFPGFLFFRQESDVICIKGVSDDKEKYFASIPKLAKG